MPLAWPRAACAAFAGRAGGSCFFNSQPLTTGSSPGLAGGDRPPSTAEITFHAAIRAAVKLEPEQELGTAAPSGPSKYVAPKVKKKTFNF